MSQPNILLEARRLYDLGFAIIWLHPNGKRPIESGWTTGPRTPWQDLKKSYRVGNNVGVRTGTASKIGKHYLTVIDVDIKKPEFEAKALAKVKELVGLARCPVVYSGSGNGSRHFYCLSPKPFKMITALKEEGGEVCIYSEGRQMVLPPSKTVKPYKWAWQLDHVDMLPEVQFEIPAAAPSAKPLANPEKAIDVVFKSVDLDWLPISDAVRDAILLGTNVEDRSGYLLQATTALESAGLTRDEILSVLTDPNTFLGKCAYDHAKTKDRAAAAGWLFKYTVGKVLKERSAEAAFIGAPKPTPGRTLSEAEVTKQSNEMASDLDWRRDLVRGGKEGMGPPISSIQNVVLILTNTVVPDLVKHNEFALRDTYTMNVPWGPKEGALVGDTDVPRIIYWLSQHWRFEPPARVIEGALTVMALKNSFDPVRDWLDALPKWDGVKRLNRWLVNHFEADGDPVYLAQVFEKWMSAMVRRIYEPGAKFDWMPIFEGPQGAGKSSFGRLLVGDQYFVDWLPNLADKDAGLSLQGRWSVEMGELSNFRRTELETIKAFLTRTVDKFRPPHGKKLIDSARRCVFFGTTNRQTYLIDDTGNRRFKPVKVGSLDFEVLRAERELLFAEALHLYRTKYNTDLAYELTGQAKVFEAIIHQQKLVEDEADVMYLAMQDFLQKVDSGDAQFDREKFRILELFQGVAPLAKWPQTQRNIMFAGKMLKKFGGEKRHIKGYVYWRIAQGDTFSTKEVTLDFY
jgi:hypothetical protein